MPFNSPSICQSCGTRVAPLAEYGLGFWYCEICAKTPTANVMRSGHATEVEVMQTLAYVGNLVIARMNDVSARMDALLTLLQQGGTTPPAGT